MAMAKLSRMTILSVNLRFHFSLDKIEGLVTGWLPVDGDDLNSAIEERFSLRSISGEIISRARFYSRKEWREELCVVPNSACFRLWNILGNIEWREPSHGALMSIDVDEGDKCKTRYFVLVHFPTGKREAFEMGERWV